MFSYLLKRILFFLLAFFCLTLVTFFITKKNLGDPVLRIINSSSEDATFTSSYEEKEYRTMQAKMGLNQPIFYLQIQPACYPDTLHTVVPKKKRNLLKKQCFNYGDWKQTLQLESQINQFIQKAKNVELKRKLEVLQKSEDKNELNTHFNQLLLWLKNSPRSLKKRWIDSINQLNQTIDQVNENRSIKKHIPAFQWNGLKNQFHFWLFGDQTWFGKPNENYRSQGIMRGDFGLTFQEKRPVMNVVKPALWLTTKLLLWVVLFTYSIALFTGVYSTKNHQKRAERNLSKVLLALYAMPNFWVGTLLILVFCNPNVLNWLPISYSFMDVPENASSFEKIGIQIQYLILPLFCWIYGSIACVSLQLKEGLLDVFNQDYITSAKSKGLSTNQVVWKHALKNALLPLITLFSSVFPMAVSGAIVVETLFSIPGMGLLSYEALLDQDYPKIYAIMFFTALLTMVGNLVADILYTIIDPRINFKAKA